MKTFMKFFLFKSFHKKGNWTFVIQTVFWGKYNIEFRILIKIQSKKNLFKSVQKQQNWTVVVRRVIEESTISNFEFQSKFQVKEEKNIQISQKTTKLD